MEIDFLTEDDAWLALPEREALARRAARAVFEVLSAPEPPSELSVVFTSDEAVAELNRTWRGKAGPTNVLSFPAAFGGAGPGQGQGPGTLGDIVLAAGVVCAEAMAQGKPLANHTVHLIIHGMLHLLGHDHADDATAEAMERLEAETMARLGLPDPYGDATAPGRDMRPRATG
ncbi:MAG TPA: rRNA maturation RNase YbeY [Aestuariivirgaceae bacterium]|nr:rRNA maturation RNase YbeY [Aestuariivirgaceae bacterium]